MIAAVAKFGKRPTGEIQDADAALPANRDPVADNHGRSATDIIGSGCAGQVVLRFADPVFGPAEDVATTLIESSNSAGRAVSRTDHEIIIGRLSYSSARHVERCGATITANCRPIAKYGRSAIHVVSADPRGALPDPEFSGGIKRAA